MNLFSNPLEVYVIKTPNSNRGDALIDSLSNSDFINLHVFSAIMIKSDAEINCHEIKVNQFFSKAIYGRILSYPEIGCAASHNEVRSLIAESSIGGVVLEDDAEIIDLEQFYFAAAKFLDIHEADSRVLSLTYGVSDWNRKEYEPKVHEIQLLGEPPLAAAYVITPLAAKRLVQANHEISYVADWPTASVRYFTLNFSLVKHDSEFILSTIDPTGMLNRKARNIKFRLLKYTFVPFFVARSAGIGLAPYTEFHFIKPIRHHIDQARLSLLRKKRVL